MAQPVVKASLATLPPELLEYIFPDRRALKVSMEDERLGHQVEAQTWLALKHEWRHFKYNEETDSYHDAHGPHYVLQDLRALSHVCRSLRAYALPLLWDIVHIQTVREMRILAKALRVLPYIAPLIRSFKLLWDMHGDWYKLQELPKEAESYLDMAFRDRLPLWDSLPPPSPFHYRTRMSPPGSGPDGDGEDASIKAPQDFNNCIEEIVAQLPNVEVFGWNSPAAVMPLGVFEALKQASKLRALSIRFETRNTMHVVPYWELTPQLETLSVDIPTCTSISQPRLSPHIPETEEVMEDEIMSFELPPPSLTDSPDADLELHIAIFSRMIVTAAKGGRLRNLRGLDSHAIQKPFAIRSLLPCWVGVNDWGNLDEFWQIPVKRSWTQAAAVLRQALAHASTNLPGAVAQGTRLLTTADVQSLYAFFTRGDVWHGNVLGESPGGRHLAVVLLYLPWLEEDAELAQQVATAWNAVVERGEADKVGCYCIECCPESHARFAEKRWC